MENEEMKSSVSSVELKRNSKGQTEIKVKVYDEDAKKARDEAKAIFDDLDARYTNSELGSKYGLTK